MNGGGIWRASSILMLATVSMTATRWDHDEYTYNFEAQEWNTPTDKSSLEEIEKTIEKMRKPSSKAFLPYSIGLYTTAYAREHLFNFMKASMDPDGDTVLLYCDTDSVKGVHLNRAGIDKFNEEVRKQSDAAGFTALDAKGEKHYIGVFEHEADYERFIALHAKCYAYEEKGGPIGPTRGGAPLNLHATIAGVTAHNGYPHGDPRRITREDELHSLEELENGKIFTACGGTRAQYISHEHDIEINGEYIHSYGGCAILDTTYEIGGVNDLLAMYGISDPELPYK